jgi:signal transduction histidine kinase
VEGRVGVRLTCVDTGIGIDASEWGLVFTPFYRSSSSQARARPGTGLGLAITERVVKAHQGTIAVESELGAGTTFDVWLPLARTADVR